MKTCYKCGGIKPKAEFHKNSSRADGLQHICIACRSHVRKTYYKNNKDAEIKSNSEWYANNPAYASARATERKLAKSNRTPKWANRREIQKIYEEANEFKQAGLDVNVDHIIPLRGKLVSGLHVHGNLRVILSSHNSKKSNKWDI